VSHIATRYYYTLYNNVSMSNTCQKCVQKEPNNTTGYYTR